MPNTTIKSPRLLNEILKRIMAGDTLKNICSKPGMPNRSTIHRWLMNDKKFSKAYRKATAVRAHEFIVEALEIADRPKKSNKDVAADRLRISTRLKLAAVLNPGHFSTRPPKPKKPITEKDPITGITVKIIEPGDPEHSALASDSAGEYNPSDTDANGNGDGQFSIPEEL
jgi:hypothetical protein